MHACRYCGLLEASVAAYEQARRLDPEVRTSVGHTYFALGDYEKVVITDVEGTPYIRNVALGMMGREAEAAAALRAAEPTLALRMRDFAIAARALLEGKREESLQAMGRLADIDFPDPEGVFYVARHLSYLGHTKRAIDLLERVVDKGYFCFPQLARDSWFDPLRTEPEFGKIIRRAEALHREAVRAFQEAGGERVLGIV